LSEASLGLGVKDELAHALELGRGAAGASIEDARASVLVPVQAIRDTLAAEFGFGYEGSMGGGDGIRRAGSTPTSRAILLLLAKAEVGIECELGR